MADPNQGGKQAPTQAASPTPGNANDFIEQQLDNRIQAIEHLFQADALSFCGPLLSGVDDLIRNAIERRCKKQPHYNKLAIILTTDGGYIEVVQRIVDTLRRYYSIVDFIVPNYA